MTTAVAIAAAGFSVAGVRAQGEPGRVTMTSGAAQDPPVRYHLDIGTSVGEPVVLEVTLVNGGGGTLAVDWGLSNRTQFVFDVAYPDGTRSRSRPLPRDGFQPGGRFRLESRETATVSISLSNLFVFKQEGVYVVSLAYEGTVMRQGASVPVQRQARWEFTLGRRDPAVLRRKCENLLAKILSTVNAQEQEASVIALASVRDEVAVPYLLRSAEARDLATEEIEALEKIAGPEGRMAMERLAKGPNAWTAASARAALVRIR